LRLRPEARSVVIVQHRDELLETYEQMELGGAPNLMVQEYLPGRADSVWMFNGYFDKYSECLVSFTGTKLRQYPPSTGATSLGVCRHNPAVEQTAKDLLKSIGYHGIGASFRLFVARNGMDVARAMYLDLTGQSVPEAQPDEGRKWFVEHFDLLSSYAENRNQELSIGDWARSFRGVREAAWFAWDDLKPFLAMCRRLGNGGIRRLPRRLFGGLRPGLVRHGGIRRGGSGAQRHSVSTVGPMCSDDGPEAVSEPGGNGSGWKAPQQFVDARFAAEASYWRDVYRDQDVQSAIYQYRLALALDWIDRLNLTPGSRVLEVGSGAGLLSVLLARRGLEVRAVDTASAMLQLTIEHAAEAGFASQIHATFADAHLLPYRARTFSLVVALGVLPWLHSPHLAMQEMSHVLRPGGYLLVSIDNRRRLTNLVDPLLSPPLQPLRTTTKRVLAPLGLWRRTDQLTEPVAQPTMHDPAEFEDLVMAVGLRPVKRLTFGFGPFTLFGQELLRGKPGPQWNHVLQRLADRNLSGLRLSGAQCLVMAEKPAT
jgi:ubiquinone/menaquinone biosynthesis C-methylase UbiE